jgi:lipopolysaccharide export LptBFGC system permease protein LptF
MSEKVDSTPPPPHAFTQGVGTVFQFVGVILFLISMFTCCSTSLLSKDTATHSGLTTIGWHRAGDPRDQPTYSAQRALTITLPASLVYGMALAALGLGLQAENRNAVVGAVTLNTLAVIFWIVQLAFFVTIKWIILSMICTLLVMLAIGLTLLSVGAVRDMRAGKEIPHAT